MGNLAEKHDEDSNAQLVDAEISRILTALNTAEFKRSERANARPDKNFKPRSLMEIAETAQKNDEAIQNAEKSTGTAIIDAASEDAELESDPVNSDDNRQDNDTDLDSNGSLDITTSDASQPLLETLSGSDESPSTDVSGSGDTAHSSDEHHDVDQMAQTSPFETAQAAYDRGYIDGSVAGREKVEAELRPIIEAEFETKLAEKIGAFESALTALAKPQTSDTKSLSLSLQAAVVRLAAARVGTAIDELPELMMTRIQNLADAAGKNVASGHIFMHPDDCAVIAPIMATRQDKVKIEADPALYRGDVRIRFDGIDISDIADLRADWKSPQSVVHENSVEIETFQNKPSDAKLETQTTKNLSPDPQDVSVQSSIMPPSPGDNENGKPLIESSEENEAAPPSEAIGLMPLTTTAVDDPARDEGTENEEATPPSEAIGLMPLTTTAVDDPTRDEGTENEEAAPPSEAIGLMPLTSKNIEE